MEERVVVLGAGYAGCVAIQALERRLDDDARLTWIADVDYHLVLHEVHRAIRDPGVADAITIPVEAIKRPTTRFVEGRVSGLDVSARHVRLADGRRIDYDYLVVCLGSETAFYGIPGLEARAHALKRLDDALGIHDAVVGAGRSASAAEPARVVIGGAGLSGVQTAGEVAALRDRRSLPVEITLVEAVTSILPRFDDALGERVGRLLAARDVEVLTDDPVVEAGADALHFDRRSPVPYDVLVWTGGITGQEAMAGVGIDADHDRMAVDATLQTSDERVFAVGDAAVVGLDGGTAPPTAQAAWGAAAVAAANVANAIAGEPLSSWTHRDRGTLVSVGAAAVAHGVPHLPLGTFGGPGAAVLKKLVAARWIASITSWRRGLAAWDVL